MIARRYSDMVTPYSVSQYMLDHLPRSVIRRAGLRNYRGGHMFYIDANSARIQHRCQRFTTASHDNGERSRHTAEGRDQFIPVRKSDILDALVGIASSATIRSGRFRQVCRMLGAIYHYEYFERLEALRRDYYYFDPALDPRARFDATSLERSYGQLNESFTAVLKGANFVEVSHEEVERSHREDVLVRVSLRAPVEEFREVRFFRRGHHQETFEIPRWFGLRRRKVEAMVYDDVVLMVAMKSEADLGVKASKKRRAQRKSRAGSVLIKYFRDIASADLNALFPNVRSS
jgi:hypothetical protein